MSNFKRLIFALLALLLSSCGSNETSFYKPSGYDIQNLPGKYRLVFHSNPPPKSGWDYNYREELMVLTTDSNFIIERVRPQGGFQVVPQTGTWTYTNDKVILDSGREFIFVKNGLIEPCNKERNDLSNVLWKKE